MYCLARVRFSNAHITYYGRSVFPVAWKRIWRTGCTGKGFYFHEGNTMKSITALLLTATLLLTIPTFAETTEESLETLCEAVGGTWENGECK